MEDKFQEALDRLARTEAELGRIKRALIACMEGRQFDEAFDDELYIESKSDEREAKNRAARIMEHILKLAYSTAPEESPCRNEWKEHFYRHRGDLDEILEWGTDRDEVLISKTIANLQKAYKGARGFYKRAMEQWTDLEENYKYIPLNCPWELEELMESPLNQLLKKLEWEP